MLDTQVLKTSYMHLSSNNKIGVAEKVSLKPLGWMNLEGNGVEFSM